MMKVNLTPRTMGPQTKVCIPCSSISLVLTPDDTIPGPQFVLPPLRNLLEEPRIRDALDGLIEAIMDAAPEKSQGGGRFSLGEIEMMSATCSLLSSTGNTLAKLLGTKWDHSDGTILRRLLPTLFSTRDSNEWNLFLRRYRAKLVARGERGLYKVSLGFVFDTGLM